MPPERSSAPEQATFAAALCGDTPVAGIHDGRGRPAADRLRVYRNNVIVSLRDALGATFPVTARLMGERYFEAAAVAFAEVNKPRSPILLTYGEGFPTFLAGLPGLAPYPFVPEVAALEYARLGAYHAADAAPLVPDGLAALAAEALPRVVLEPHPATALLFLPHGGFGAYCANAQDPDVASAPAAAVLVTRPQMTVRLTPLHRSAAAIAQTLLAGAPLGAVAAASDELAAALGTFLTAGAFCGLRIGDV